MRHIYNKNITDSRGLTLIEMVLYIGLLSIIMTGFVQFGWNVVYSRIKSNVQKEVSANLRLAGKRIGFEIRSASASGILSLAASDLCLKNSTSTYNPTRLYLSSGRVRVAWGGGSVNCTSMTNDQPLTSNKVNVNNLSFTNTSSGSASYNIRYSLTISSVNPSGRQEWNKTQSATSTAELRSN